MHSNLIDNESKAKAPTKDLLSLAWYEVGRTRLKRRTKNGFEVDIKRVYGQDFQVGELLQTTAQTSVCVEISPCICIVLHAKDLATTGSFCYDVGNRHLPIFEIDCGIAVAYDARLYEALSVKYGKNISLQNSVLAPSNKIKNRRKMVG